MLSSWLPAFTSVVVTVTLNSSLDETPPRTMQNEKDPPNSENGIKPSKKGGASKPMTTVGGNTVT